MFDIGFTELFIVALVGLIVLGPKRLPEVARTVGQWLGKVRRFVADVKQDIDREMQQGELAELRSLKQDLDETRRTMEETSDRLAQQANIMPPDATAAPSAGSPPEPAPKPRSAKRAGGRRKKSSSKQAHDRSE